MCWSRVDVKASMTSAREGSRPSRARYEVDPLRYRDRGVVIRRGVVEGSRPCVLRAAGRGPLPGHLTVSHFRYFNLPPPILSIGEPSRPALAAGRIPSTQRDHVSRTHTVRSRARDAPRFPKILKSRRAGVTLCPLGDGA